MDVSKLYNKLGKTRIFLVFFCVISFYNCADTAQDTIITVHYTRQKASSIRFTHSGEVGNFKLFLNEKPEIPIFGEFTSEGNKVRFTPVVPFSAKQQYRLQYGGQLIGTFKIADNKDAVAPQLLAIYPTTDTVPENLLKMYFVFSRPMQEVGKALDFIKVTNNADGRETDVFLDLQPELWNKEHTRLTLWLDPGRIKTDLIPNQKRGLPIVKGNQYTVTVSDDWKGAAGNKLDKTYTKSLKVVTRDDKKPVVNSWKINSPKNGTNDTLIIDLNESLDAILLKESFLVQDTDGKEVIGNYKLGADEKSIHFIPLKYWNKESYNIKIKSILEDLAGNNLNHLFDVDLKQGGGKEAPTEFKTLSFTVL